ncbi:hypothetical protein [Haloferula sargassicola]
MKTAVLSALGMTGAACALEIRDTSSGHFVWLWEMYANATLNPLFEPDPNIIRQGTGWPDGPQEWHRNLAMVSPVHFIGVAHYPFDETRELKFLGSDGVVRGYPLVGQEVVAPGGVATDITVGTLAEPLDPSTGVKPYPVAVFPTRADFLQRDLVVVGKAGWAAPGRYEGFEMLVNSPGFDTTDYIYFDFPYEPGGPGDLRFQGGDSGSPTLILQDGEWCVVGVHSGLEEVPAAAPVASRSYDAFLPTYYGEIDALMEPEGYHLIRRHPETVALTVAADTAEPLVAGQPGTVQVRLSGTGADAHNVKLKFTAAGFTGLTAAGWVQESLTPGSWRGRRGGLGDGETVTLEASWSALPAGPVLAGTVGVSADGHEPESVPVSWPVMSPAAAAYAEWSAGLADPAFDADPDGDHLRNLLEYAVGGDPAVAQSRAFTSTGTEDGRLVIEFPRRLDRLERGLSYEVQFASEALIWGPELPEGTEVTTGPCDPPRDGFEKVRVAVPPAGGAGFLRLQVAFSG